MSLVLVALATGAQAPKRTVIRPEDLPKPYATSSVRAAPVVVRKKGMPELTVPPGFKTNLFAVGLRSPRSLYVLPNGDVLCLESYQGRIIILRDADKTGRAEVQQVFATGFRLPYGIALKDGYLYVANTNSVVRFPYRDGDLKARGPRETIISGIPSRGYRQHWTRNLAFSPDGRHLYLTVGSETNKSPEKPPRATILRFNADGTGRQTFATGLRNPVGIAFRPGTQELWVTCVERDYMGDNLVPDFFTRVDSGDFFGWPWYYIGRNRDPRVPLSGAPKKEVAVPDVLFHAHSTPLGLIFYTGDQFPTSYKGDAFIAMRGSTNRRQMSGYRVVRIRFDNGKLVPGFEDFVTGWAPNPNSRNVHGRPVGLAQANDGSLLISDEAGHVIWRVMHPG